MNITETFGQYVTKYTDRNPAQGRRLLKLGWEAQNFKFRHFPDQRLMPADRYLAQFMMESMLAPLKSPDHSAIVSIFVPCELLQEAGLHPYNAEAFSCYLEASRVERYCLQQTENDGLSETLCSYHRTFIGAAERGLMPKPKCIVYTNLTCDANLVTFRHLADLYHVPCFSIDVPMAMTEADISYVEKQLRDLKLWLEHETGKTIEEDKLRSRVERSRRTLMKFEQYQAAKAEKYVPTDLVTPLYSGMTNNILLGTEQNEHYVDLLNQDIKKAGPARGQRIYWMHTLPFWSDAVRSLLYFKEDAQIVGDELQSVCSSNFDPSNPYRAMASRMVHHALNGSIHRRIDNGIAHARALHADGVVWFNHWGCKHTLGGALLAKKKFEEAGLPCLLLDGDGCDRSHGGEGQTLTRLGAFLEMLEADKAKDSKEVSA